MYVYYFLLLLFYRYMLKTFSKDPNYWDNLAKNELINDDTKSEKLKIKYEHI